MSSPPCPRCNVPLAHADVPPFAMLGCGRCGGVWLDHAAVRAVLAPDAGEPRIEELAARAARATSVRPDPRPASLRCPICEAAMARCEVTHARVAVDTCNLHGTWFDADEVRRVRAGLAPPITTRIVEVRIPVRQEDDFDLWWNASGDDGTGRISVVGVLAGVAFQVLGSALTSSGNDD